MSIWGSLKSRAVAVQKREDSEGRPAWAPKGGMGFEKLYWIPLPLSLSQRVHSQSLTACQHTEGELTISVEKH